MYAHVSRILRCDWHDDVNCSGVLVAGKECVGERKPKRLILWRAGNGGRKMRFRNIEEQLIARKHAARIVERREFGLHFKQIIVLRRSRETLFAALRSLMRS